MTEGFPRFHPIAEHGLMIDFGDRIDPAIHDLVLAADAALAADPFPGLCETIPSHASLLIRFDPLVCDHGQARLAAERAMARGGATRRPARQHEVAVCYEGELAPDLAAVAKQTGQSVEAVIAAHLAGDYQVYMYGFAPGYAYLAGLPAAIRLPRKPAAIRGIPAGSVLIAGPQCLVTTLTMPTGWWIIGRSPTRILTGDPAQPFLFEVGDRIRFHRIARKDLPDGGHDHG